MSDETYSFSTARARLDEIVTQVRKKDTSLEKSLDLLEEGVKLANACTELIDHADWTVGGVADQDEAPRDGEPASDGEPTAEVVSGDSTGDAVPVPEAADVEAADTEAWDAEGDDA